MADNDEIVRDVAGQEGGPSAEEQARVDAEQRELMAANAEARRPFEIAEQQARDEREQAALAAIAERRSMSEAIRQLEARVKVLEAKYAST